jgi:hypothetical protein
MGFLKNPNKPSSLSAHLEEQIPKFRIFDTPDYIIPPNEFNSIFLMTKFIETIQTQSLCGEVSAT